MKTALLICDMWDDHWCKTIKRNCSLLAPRINKFACRIRYKRVQIIHCPSETVDRFYADWYQRGRMKEYPYCGYNISEVPREFLSPLDTYATNGCPDEPKCFYQTEFIQQQDSQIEIYPRDLITDSGQELANFVVSEGIESVLLTGMALNMCILGRAFGLVSLREMGIRGSVVSDLVDIAYSPKESPFLSHKDALKLSLTCISEAWGGVIHSRSV